MNIQDFKKYKILNNEKLISLDKLEYQGYSNTNYLLKTSKNKYIIRYFKTNENVNISRQFEYKIQKKAYKKKLASKPILLNEKNKFMISKYLEGNHKYKLNQKEIKLLAKNIKTLHKIKSSVKEYSFKKDIKYYTSNLNNKKAKTFISICKKELLNIKKYKKTLALVHHDLNPKNILFFKKNIKFIDWEYVGVNDAFFDLATVCYEFKFNKKEEKIFLKSYLKEYHEHDIKKLHSYINLYKYLCKLWFMNYHK